MNHPATVTARTPPSAPAVVTNAFDWQQHHVAMPEPLAIPQMPVVTEIETEADEPDERAPPAAVSNPFAGLADRAAVPAANDPSVERDADAPPRGGDANAQLRHAMAPRLVRARLLSGLTQGEVARLLNYKNSSQLNQWEQGRRLAPVVEIVRVAEVLGVSESYLLGTSPGHERDQAAALRSACLRGLRKQLARVAEITVDEVARHARLVGPHAGHVRGVLAAGDALLEAFGTFARANMGAFENQRGSANLLKRTQDLETSLEGARAAIRLHDALDGDLRRALADLAIEDELVGDEEA